jgi:hypothetical protein
MVIARCGGPQFTELSSSLRKARAGVAGSTMWSPSRRSARIRCMANSDALLLLRTVGPAAVRN